MKSTLILALVAVLAPAIVLNRVLNWPEKQLVSLSPLTLNLAAETQNDFTYPLAFTNELSYVLQRPSNSCLTKSILDNVVKYGFHNASEQPMGSECWIQLSWTEDVVYVSKLGSYATLSDVRLIYHTDVVEVQYKDKNGIALNAVIGAPDCAFSPTNDTDNGPNKFLITLTISKIAQPMACQEINIVFNSDVHLVTETGRSAKHSLFWTIIVIMLCVFVVVGLTTAFCYWRGLGCWSDANGQLVKPIDSYAGINSGAGSPQSAVQTKSHTTAGDSRVL